MKINLNAIEYNKFSFWLGKKETSYTKFSNNHNKNSSSDNSFLYLNKNSKVFIKNIISANIEKLFFRSYKIMDRRVLYTYQKKRIKFKKFVRSRFNLAFINPYLLNVRTRLLVNKCEKKIMRNFSKFYSHKIKPYRIKTRAKPLKRDFLFRNYHEIIYNKTKGKDKAKDRNKKFILRNYNFLPSKIYLKFLKKQKRGIIKTRRVIVRAKLRKLAKRINTFKKNELMLVRKSLNSQVLFSRFKNSLRKNRISRRILLTKIVLRRYRKLLALNKKIKKKKRSKTIPNIYTVNNKFKIVYFPILLKKHNILLKKIKVKVKRTLILNIAKKIKRLLARKKLVKFKYQYLHFERKYLLSKLYKSITLNRRAKRRKKLNVLRLKLRKILKIRRRFFIKVKKRTLLEIRGKKRSFLLRPNGKQKLNKNNKTVFAKFSSKLNKIKYLFLKKLRARIFKNKLKKKKKYIKRSLKNRRIHIRNKKSNYLNKKSRFNFYLNKTKKRIKKAYALPKKHSKNYYYSLFKRIKRRRKQPYARKRLKKLRRFFSRKRRYRRKRDVYSKRRISIVTLRAKRFYLKPRFYQIKNLAPLLHIPASPYDHFTLDLTNGIGYGDNKTSFTPVIANSPESLSISKSRPKIERGYNVVFTSPVLRSLFKLHYYSVLKHNLTLVDEQQKRNVFILSNYLKKRRHDYKRALNVFNKYAVLMKLKRVHEMQLSERKKNNKNNKENDIVSSKSEIDKNSNLETKKIKPYVYVSTFIKRKQYLNFYYKNRWKLNKRRKKRLRQRFKRVVNSRKGLVIYNLRVNRPRVGFRWKKKRKKKARFWRKQFVKTGRRLKRMRRRYYRHVYAVIPFISVLNKYRAHLKFLKKQRRLVSKLVKTKSYNLLKSLKLLNIKFKIDIRLVKKRYKFIKALYKIRKKLYKFATTKRKLKKGLFIKSRNLRQNKKPSKKLAYAAFLVKSLKKKHYLKRKNSRSVTHLLRKFKLNVLKKSFNTLKLPSGGKGKTRLRLLRLNNLKKNKITFNNISTDLFEKRGLIKRYRLFFNSVNKRIFRRKLLPTSFVVFLKFNSKKARLKYFKFKIFNRKRYKSRYKYRQIKGKKRPTLTNKFLNSYGKNNGRKSGNNHSYLKTLPVKEKKKLSANLTPLVRSNRQAKNFLFSKLKKKIVPSNGFAVKYALHNRLKSNQFCFQSVVNSEAVNKKVKNKNSIKFKSNLKRLKNKLRIGFVRTRKLRKYKVRKEFLANSTVLRAFFLPLLSFEKQSKRLGEVKIFSRVCFSKRILITLKKIKTLLHYSLQIRAKKKIMQRTFPFDFKRKPYVYHSRYFAFNNKKNHYHLTKRFLKKRFQLMAQQMSKFSGKPFSRKFDRKNKPKLNSFSKPLSLSSIAVESKPKSLLIKSYLSRIALPSYSKDVLQRTLSTLRWVRARKTVLGRINIADLLTNKKKTIGLEGEQTIILRNHLNDLLKTRFILSNDYFSRPILKKTSRKFYYYSFKKHYYQMMDIYKEASVPLDVSYLSDKRFVVNSPRFKKFVYKGTYNRVKSPFKKGKIIIRFKKNNVFMCLLNKKNQVVTKVSAGGLKFRAKARSTPFSKEIAAVELSKRAFLRNYKVVDIKSRNYNRKHNYKLAKGFARSKLFIRTVDIQQKIPHGYIRLKKPRRI